jgi:outer membrane lipoprotein-sorting protein
MRSIWLSALVVSCQAGELSSAVSSWIASQTNVQTWSADFIQIRRLKSLTRPLTASGHVWFAAPNRFHWELGNPPQTIAVRAPIELLILYPRLKRVERFPLSSEESGPWRQALALLETGFPRSQAELESQYDIISQDNTGEICTLVLQPKSTGARRMMPQIKIDFATQDKALRATELQFADGSIMRNEFKNVERNPKLDEKLFTLEIPADYKVVEPLKKPAQ